MAAKDNIILYSCLAVIGTLIGISLCETNTLTCIKGGCREPNTGDGPTDCNPEEGLTTMTCDLPDDLCYFEEFTNDTLKIVEVGCRSDCRAKSNKFHLVECCLSDSCNDQLGSTAGSMTSSMFAIVYCIVLVV